MTNHLTDEWVCWLCKHACSTFSVDTEAFVLYRCIKLQEVRAIARKLRNATCCRFFGHFLAVHISTSGLEYCITKRIQ